MIKVRVKFREDFDWGIFDKVVFLYFMEDPYIFKNFWQI